MIKRIPVKVLGTLVVTSGIILILIPYGLFIGYVFPFNLLLWFVIIPALAVWLPLIIRKKPDHLWESVWGLVLLYLILVWMIYNHYQSEFFAVMMVSAATNVLILVVIGLSRTFLSQPGSLLSILHEGGTRDVPLPFLRLRMSRQFHFIFKGYFMGTTGDWT